MLLTKFSNLRIVHTAGTNLPVADMLSRDFSSINSTSSQLKHKTLPPHIQFVQLNPNNTLEETHYLVQHEEVLPSQKMILALFSLIMAQNNILYVSMIVETMLQSHPLIHSLLKA